MNIRQMHVGVNLEVQKIASNLNDDLLPQEIDYYLNEAVDDFIEQQYVAMKSEDRNLEGQHVNDNLIKLISTAEISNLSAVEYIPNSMKGSIPGDYRYYIFSKTKRDGKWVNNRKLEPKAIKQYVETATNIPIYREFPILLEGENIIVIGDSRADFDPNTEIRLTYVKEPEKIEFPGDGNDYPSFPNNTHRQIVKMAAGKILQSLNIGQQQPQGE